MICCAGFCVVCLQPEAVQCASDGPSSTFSRHVPAHYSNAESVRSRAAGLQPLLMRSVFFAFVCGILRCVSAEPRFSSKRAFVTGRTQEHLPAQGSSTLFQCRTGEIARCWHAASAHEEHFFAQDHSGHRLFCHVICRAGFRDVSQQSPDSAAKELL